MRPLDAALSALAALCSYDYEGDAADQGDAAEDRWDGDGAGLFVLDIQWADFCVLVFVREAEASDSEADDADDDQDEADNGSGFHGWEMLLSDLNSVDEMQISTEERYRPLT